MRGLRGAGIGIVLGLVFLTGTTGAQAASINVVGPEEMVYDYDTMSCFQFDQPDIPVRAFRDNLNRVQMILPSAQTRMIGPDLNNLTHDCNVVMPNLNRPLPSDYADADWTSATYTSDGQTIYSLLHSEYHPHVHPGYCGEPFVKCRYNTVTMAVSTNGGELYVRPSPPGHLVAAMPYRYVPGDGRYGFFSPSNIIEKDGWYYNMPLVSTTYRAQRGGVCLMRTQNLGDPKSWRAWDGTGFNARFIDPYRESGRPVSAHVCEPVGQGTLRDINRSITYNTLIDKYVAIGTSEEFVPSFGRSVVGFYYSFSDDLIEWTDSQLLFEIENGRTWQCGDPDPVSYPSFLDPDSTDRNFNTSNQRLYLYYSPVRFVNCINTQTRDLVRREIEFVP
jgi:hypothetical protein